MRGHTHLPNAVFVEVVIVAQDGDLVRHCSTYTRPVVYLRGERRCQLSSQEADNLLYLNFTAERKTYSPSSEQMAAFDRLKDVGGQFRLAGQVGLGQGLLHSLNLHQTQRPLVPCSTHRQTFHSGR